MFVKIVILFTMFMILISLGSGLFFLVKDEGTTKRTVKALTWRISLSLGLFVFLVIGFGTGFITPHSL